MKKQGGLISHINAQEWLSKDEFWGFVKALKPQRTEVREDLRVEVSAENRLGKSFSKNLTSYET